MTTEDQIKAAFSRYRQAVGYTPPELQAMRLSELETTILYILEQDLNQRIERLHGPGAVKAIEEAYEDGSLFSDNRPPTGRFFLNGFVSHAVKESSGEQGRAGQVVAYCGFGRVNPTFIDVLDPGLHIMCKICEVRMPRADA